MPRTLSRVDILRYVLLCPPPDGWDFVYATSSLQDFASVRLVADDGRSTDVVVLTVGQATEEELGESVADLIEDALTMPEADRPLTVDEILGRQGR